MSFNCETLKAFPSVSMIRQGCYSPFLFTFALEDLACFKKIKKIGKRETKVIACRLYD